MWSIDDRPRKRKRGRHALIESGQLSVQTPGGRGGHSGAKTPGIDFLRGEDTVKNQRRERGPGGGGRRGSSEILVRGEGGAAKQSIVVGPLLSMGRARFETQLVGRRKLEPGPVKGGNALKHRKNGEKVVPQNSIS